ncbi:MAG TPA: hypothetical protein PK668_13515 [Myxococcota bacterium]|nr:hypothetical protein [Myxococcota bacterium]HRY94119.1 hypothetical protein [Myxococcota bacterium]HSA22918.1 hypothetical protein [Myxococcota bacterium]
MSAKKRAARRIALALGLCAWGGSLAACGTVDDGTRTLGPIQRLPDPERFARQVHPQLSSACAAAACHGREDASLRLTASPEPLPAASHPVHPLDLPQPFLADYYTVLAFCDLGFPEASQLLAWGADEPGSHPGRAALTPAAREEILSWLRSSAGGPP